MKELCIFEKDVKNGWTVDIFPNNNNNKNKNNNDKLIINTMGILVN